MENSLITEQKELAENLQYRCKQFEHCMSIGTSPRDYLAPIEEKYKTFVNKEKFLLQNSDAQTKAAYNKLELLKETEHIIIQTRDKILDAQSKAIVELNTIATNFNKDSKERKTATYAETKIKKLNKAWDKIVDINDAINLFPDKQDSYFTTGIFQKEKEKYHTLKKKLEAIIKDKGDADKKLKDLEDQLKAHQNDAQMMIKKQKFKITKLLEAIKIAHEPGSRTVYESRKSTINAKWTNIEALHEEIMTSSDNIPEAYEELYNEVEKQFNQTNIFILEKIDVEQQNQQQHIQQTNEWNVQKLKIKPLELGKFSGDFKTWHTFYETFTDAVRRAGCSNVEKFHYLNNSIDGDAKRIISHLQISGANYDVAIGLLKDRYENTRKVTMLYLDTIIDIPPINHRSTEGIINMHDTLNDCIININKMGFNTEDWGPIIIQLMMKKLDFDTLKNFEETLDHPKEIPTLAYFIDFLRTRHETLDSIRHNKRTYKEAENKPKMKTTFCSTKKQCAYCEREHALYECETFKKEDISKRRDFIYKQKLCTICLSHNYKKRCHSKHTCGVCRKPHNTLLHEDKRSKPFNSKEETPETTKKTLVSKLENNDANVLLSTALVKVKSANGEEHLLRALIDPASQATIISENTAQLLNFRREKSNTGIIGMGVCHSGTAKAQTRLTIQPRYPSDYTLSMVALILPKLTSKMPSEEAVVKQSGFKNILLADPTFDTPGPIHIVIGADYYGCLIEEGIIKTDGILAQKTNLGWIVTGPALYKSDVKRTKNAMSFVTNIELNKMLENYFEKEEINQPRALTSEEKECERHFQQNHKRNQDGTYTVKIPFKENRKSLGESKTQAVARFHQLERKFEREPEYKKEYHKFINEYLELGHMKKSNNKNGKQENYFIPHHAVLKESSSTTKLRVVFDASANSKNGENLNQQCFTGPRLQENLARLLIRWRKHKYVFTADVEKMYRQIKIHDDDQHYQKIVWRFDKNKPIEEYQLTTVTYGTSSAPYLAIKTLQQLAHDEKTTFPDAAKIMLNDFYVDDVLSGGSSFNSTKKRVIELHTAMKKGGFNLRKWVSNEPKVLMDIPDENKPPSIVEWKDDSIISTLGLQWNPSKDNFQFSVKQQDHQLEILTKRKVLSEIAKLYDPLGWISPILIIAKIIMQEMWAANIDWDEEIPKELKERTEQFFKEIKEIESIKIPRWIQGTPIELHGFCDASNKAFAAVVYSRVQTKDGKFITTMISSKTRTAPLRNKQTLARLELCGALLLAQLMNEIKLAMRFTNVKTYLWSDSEITLAWIKGDPHRWDTYVANRVAEIQQHTKMDIWRHVSSVNNPADCASRGISARELPQLKLWWNGPIFLATSDWKKQEPRHYETNLHERKIKKVCFAKHDDDRIYERWSDLNKTIRIISYCYRFINGIRKTSIKFDSKDISTEEKTNTLSLIIQQMQKADFAEEIHNLKIGKAVKNNKNLLSLNPFLDNEGVMRVGGRLENSTLTYNQKHPIIICSGHFLTLLIRDAHKRTCHGGIELTTAVLRQNYWIVNLKRIVKQEIHHCMTCKKLKAKTSKQLMGQLPKSRIRPSRPFTHTGVDFAGPILLRMGVRGHKMMKGYIAIFVCMTTKAIHIEMVSDLTSTAFIAAYKRFVGRRGCPSKMYSDNGTNFVGANNLLQQEMKLIQEGNLEAAKALAAEGTSWQFIPPGAPNVGGLWEAGVKSVKSHLKKVIGDTPLSFEEMTTLLAQIEACLNSRPLYPITEDPEDNEILTPAHFLIGESLMAVPEREIEQRNPIRRWTLVQKITQDFWKIWSSNYLHTLQQRYKWQKKEDNLNIGDIVSIKDERLQPTKWPLARVVKIKPDADGVVRIVELQTGRSEPILRHISKLCLIQRADDKEICNKETDKDTLKRKMNESPKCVKHVKLTTIQRKPESNYKDIISSPITTTSTFTRPTARIWMRRPAGEDIKKLVPTIQKTKKRDTTISPCSWAKAILYTTTVLSVINSSHGGETSYNVTYPQPGLYLEKMGIIQLDRGHIKIECPIDLKLMETDFNNVNKTVSAFGATCDKTKDYTKDGHCSTWLSTLREKFYQLSNNIEIIKGQSTSRGKRGLFGNLLETIFGVNDEVYQSLDELEATQNSIIRRTNHQSALMLSTIHEVNSTLSRYFESVTTKLNTGFALINEMQDWFVIADKERVANQLIHTAIEAQNYIDAVNKKYEDIVKIIIHQGSIFNMIPYHKFEVLKEKLNQQLPPNLRTLNKPEERIDIFIEDTKIIISGFIRLVETSTFDLVAASFIPQRFNNNTFGTSLPETKFFAINFNDQRYFSTGLAEIEKCISLQKQVYLCAPSLIHNMEIHSDCIIDYILNRHDEWTCPVRKFEVKETVWKQLTMENTWLIINKETVHAAITCNGIRTEIKIKETAILKVQKGCIVTTKELILLSRQQSSISVHSTYQKPTNQTTLENITITKRPDSVKIAPIIGLEHSYIPDNELLKTEHIATNDRQFSHHALSSTCSIVIIIFIYITWNYRDKIPRCRTHPESKTVTITTEDRNQRDQSASEETYTTVASPRPTPSGRVWTTT